MPKEKLSDAEFAILSLLGEGNRYGYEIEALIEARGMREWTPIGFSSIYFLLDKLSKRGLARPSRAKRGAKAAKVFSITPQGRKALVATTVRLLGEPNRIFPEVLLGMANWAGLDGACGLEALGRRSAALSVELARLREKRESQRPLPDFVECLFDYTITQIEADLAWTQRTIHRLGTNVDKIDFKKKLATLYSAPAGSFAIVDVPVMQFVKIDGSGDPNRDPAYARAIEWIYSTSYAMKFAAKAKLGKDYVVPPLEGLWWADNPDDFVARRKHLWRWTMMIMVPDFVESALYEAAVEKSRAKLGEPPDTLRLEPLDEGRCLQTLHVGSYDNEGPTLARLHSEIMPAKGVTFAGPHHEIYLCDARKTPPEKLKTILRQPVRDAG
ncbi:GyrI-like domain-containing protein [Bradyrhizobium erythrophlei]|uniref:GyrI-like domain-containing protein n=1 Tax=Bradyrhizobium erythrophlei TaxID=1437360 RepID=UPI0035E585EF